MTTQTANSVLDLDRLDWSRRANCFVCHAADIPVSSGIFYEVGSNDLKHTISTNNTTGQPEGAFVHGNLDGSAFRCPHCGLYVVSGSLMASGNAAVQIREYLSTHQEYQDAPKVIHTYDVGL